MFCQYFSYRFNLIAISTAMTFVRSVRKPNRIRPTAFKLRRAALSLQAQDHEEDARLEAKEAAEEQVSGKKKHFFFLIDECVYICKLFMDMIICILIMRMFMRMNIIMLMTIKLPNYY